MSSRRSKLADTAGHKSPGKVVVDSRGRNVWQWDQDQLDSTTIMLQRLENSSLALEPTRTTRKLRLDARLRAKAQEPAPESCEPAADETADLALEGTFVFKPGGGFDPYNRS